MADLVGIYCSVAPFLFGGGGRFCSVAASRSRPHPQQCSNREPAGSARSAFCLTRHLAAIRYALVFAHCRAWVRPTDGGDFLSFVSRGHPGGKRNHAGDRSGASDFNRRGFLFFLGTTETGKRCSVGQGQIPYVVHLVCVANQFHSLWRICGRVDSGSHHLGSRPGTRSALGRGDGLRAAGGNRETFGCLDCHNACSHGVAQPKTAVAYCGAYSSRIAWLLELATMVGAPFCGRGVPALSRYGDGSAAQKFGRDSTVDRVRTR